MYLIKGLGAMNTEEGNTEYLSLKSLLHQWHLPHLLQHFMGQKINVDILKMMKTQHIFELLQNFPCGDRIRFEYELEKWRNNLGCPLENSSLTMPIVVQRGVPFETLGNKNLKNMTRDCETQTQTQISDRNAGEGVLNFQDKNHMSPPPSMSMTTSESPKRGGSQSNIIYSPSPPPQPRQSPRDPHIRGRSSTDLMILQMASQLNARDILERCRPRGPELIKIYETNKRFRPVERVELINLFAHYFYEHSIHLPVKLSYELEQQILELFPGERLRDYRTEKRGKIYIRLSNIKNNRRRAREAKANYLRGLEKIDPSGDDNGKISLIDGPIEGVIDEADCMREENSNSFDKLEERIFVNDIKCETGDEVDF